MTLLSDKSLLFLYCFSSNLTNYEEETLNLHPPCTATHKTLNNFLNNEILHIRNLYLNFIRITCFLQQQHFCIIRMRIQIYFQTPFFDKIQTKNAPETYSSLIIASLSVNAINTPDAIISLLMASSKSKHPPSSASSLIMLHFACKQSYFFTISINLSFEISPEKTTYLLSNKQGIF